jgi:outer membrane protein TolC
MILIFFISFITILNTVKASDTIQLTLESAVDIAINNSYRTRQIELELKRGMHYLNAYKAGLNTQIYMQLKSPNFSNLSDYRWNSIQGKDEIVRINSTLWQSDLSVKQPVIFFGFPTNGYLSLNYRVYNYQQRDNGSSETDWYNRLYLKFEQPIFLPNELKNDLERAELDLQDIKLRYISERIGIIERISGVYFNIFERMYHRKIYQNQLFYLQESLRRCNKIVAIDSSRQIEEIQFELEITNVEENLLTNQTLVRNELSNLRQRLRLSQDDSLYVLPVLNIVPIKVPVDQAMDLAIKNTPRLQRLHIGRKRSQIDVENEKGRNAFHMTFEATYGLEKKNQEFNNLWHQFDNSNSLTLNAYIPIWDGGQRKNRIQAEKIDITRRDLFIEQEREDIINDVTNYYTNLNDFYKRTINLQNSVRLSNKIVSESVKQYENNDITLQALIQIIYRHVETEKKFLQVYSGYRRSLLELSLQTLYNFETNQSLMEEFDLVYEDGGF